MCKASTNRHSEPKAKSLVIKMAVVETSPDSSIAPLIQNDDYYLT